MLLGCSPLTPAPSVLPVPCTWGVNSCTGPLCQGRYKCIKKGTLTSTKCICQKLCPVQRVPSPAQLQASSACLSARLKCPLIPHDHSKACRRPSVELLHASHEFYSPCSALHLLSCTAHRSSISSPCWGAGDILTMHHKGKHGGCSAAFGI